MLKLWSEPLPKPVSAEKLRLPYLDEHIVVVEKPAGITSVWHREERKLPARRRQLQPTLEELIPGALAKAIGHPRTSIDNGKSGGRPFKGRRPARKPAHPEKRWPIFPVHRLDRDTSGLMLFARTRAAEQKLVKMFRDRLVQRQYWAVATGQVTSQTVQTTLIRDRGDGLRGSIGLLGQCLSGGLPETSEGQADVATGNNPEQGGETAGQLAITHVELLEHLGDYSLVRCRLETGRTHQIRIHLSELGHPLCGEKTYIRRSDGSTWNDSSAAPRQALHAERLAFTHPFTAERLEFRMPLPSELKHWLNGLRAATLGTDVSGE